jgi:hypothetical protein
MLAGLTLPMHCKAMLCARRGGLAEGHCCLVPAEHVPSCRQVDEDVWTELRNFKKCLLQMFMAQARPPEPGRAPLHPPALSNFSRVSRPICLFCLLLGSC